MQGTADNNLTEDMADRFAAAYKAVGGTITKEIFPGQPHAFIPGNPTAPDSVRALGMIKAFIHRICG
jgi:acetyl esterase